MRCLGSGGRPAPGIIWGRMSIFGDSFMMLQKHALTNDSIIVSYSGGKDSICVLDMCVKAFKKVTCVYLYFVEEFQYNAELLDLPRQRYGIKVVKYPHWAFINSMRGMIYCDAYPEFEQYPAMDPGATYQALMHALDIPLLAMGAKKADGIWRKRWYSQIPKMKGYRNIIFPVIEWHKWDVLAYLKINKLPVPPDETAAARANGADLSTNFILWLYDNHPDDYQRLLNYFPYAEAVIYRRKYYGTDFGEHFRKKSKRPETGELQPSENQH